MNKEEFETTLESFRAALEEADRLMVEAKAEYAKASARFKEAKRQYNGHLSWGRAVGFVQEPDIIDDVVAVVAKGGAWSSSGVSAEMKEVSLKVSGALRRAVSRGLLVKREDGLYTSA